MVGTHCVRDKGTNADQWLIVSDWLMLRVIVHSSNDPQLSASGPDWLRLTVIGSGLGLGLAMFIALTRCHTIFSNKRGATLRKTIPA